MPFAFQLFDFALNNFPDELGPAIRANEMIDPLGKPFRQANDSGFHSKRRSSHVGVVTGHSAHSIIRRLKDIGY